MEESQYVSADATAMAESVRSGEVSPRELVELARRVIDRANPEVNAVTFDCFDDALARCEAGVEGPFAGVPILLKDLGAPVAGHPDHQGNATLAALDQRHDHTSWLA